MLISRKLLPLSFLALICLIIFEACGSSTPVEVNSASVTASQGAVVSPTKPLSTPTRIPTAPLFQTPTAALTPPFTPLPTVQLDSWQGQWLKGVPCQPPCWEKIVPGQTTMSEAKTLLTDSGLTRAVINTVQDAKATRGQISWRWNETLGLGEREASEPGYINYDNTGSQLIDIIAPQLYVSYQFSDILKAYGEPEYVIVLGFYPYPEATAPSFSISAIYITRGFLVYSSGLSTKPTKIDAHTTFDRVTFFVPSSVGFSKFGSGFFNPKFLVRWQGFRDFSYYCLNIDKPAC